MDSLPKAKPPTDSTRAQNSSAPGVSQVISSKPVQDRVTTNTVVSGQPIGKEEKETVGSLFKEAELRKIEQKEFTPAPEVKKWVEVVKKEEIFDDLSKVPFEDEYGQILMEQVRPTRPDIVLPLTEPEMKQGLKQAVSNSVRWLVTFCQRLIKMFPKRVSYEPSK